MSRNIRCNSEAVNLCSNEAAVFTVKYYGCLEFPENELLLTKAQCEQNPFSKLLCTFWKGEETGPQVPLNHLFQVSSEKFHHHREARRGYFE